MKIALNATIANRARTGTGQYAANLTAALMQADHDHELVVYCDREMLDWFGDRRNGHVVTMQPKEFNSPGQRIFWEQTQLSRDLQLRGVDLLHAMAFTSPCVGKTKAVVTVHDLVFKRYPETVPSSKRLYYNTVFRRSITKAASIITPTEAIRKELIHDFQIHPQRVVAIPEAAGAAFQKPPSLSHIEETLTNLEIKKPYLLTVGTLEPRKNLPLLFKAFQAFKEASGLPHFLVVAGKNGWMNPSDSAIKDILDDCEDIRLVGYVPEPDLPALYFGAELFLFPSLYEGFGIPLLEAFAAGMPVLASDIAAHREVCGDCAEFVPARDETAWSDGIRALIADRNRRRNLTHQARERAREFTWQKTAQKTLEVYQMVEAHAKA